MAEVDALSWQDFERYVADLCRRDGCTKAVVSGKSGDLGADVIGYLPDGRKLVVQVKKYAPERSVPSQNMQKFVGTSRPEHGADVAVFRTTCRGFTKAARGLAVRSAWPGPRGRRRPYGPGIRVVADRVRSTAPHTRLLRRPGDLAHVRDRDRCPCVRCARHARRRTRRNPRRYP
ncbi:restriction endonuclease [Streptomyces sp. Q6]|uniref:Restriction endonuclease n=1 Tax=Streptomyces citrinus TaxID=3118173 RepID=A0ACD5APY0_9ACTN